MTWVCNSCDFITHGFKDTWKLSCDWKVSDGGTFCMGASCSQLPFAMLIAQQCHQAHREEVANQTVTRWHFGNLLTLFIYSPHLCVGFLLFAAWRPRLLPPLSPPSFLLPSSFLPPSFLLPPPSSCSSSSLSTGSSLLTLIQSSNTLIPHSSHSSLSLTTLITDSPTLTHHTHTHSHILTKLTTLITHSPTLTHALTHTLILTTLTTLTHPERAVGCRACFGGSTGWPDPGPLSIVEGRARWVPCRACSIGAL